MKRTGAEPTACLLYLPGCWSRLVFSLWTDEAGPSVFFFYNRCEETPTSLNAISYTENTCIAFSINVYLSTAAMCPIFILQYVLLNKQQ